MDTIELDLEDLDLKSVDIGGSNTYKNINVSSTSSGITPSYNSFKPNLTVSASNNDPMPNGGLSSDKEVDFGLDLIVNKKKQRHDGSEGTSINKLGGSSNPSPTPRNYFSDNNTTTSSYPQKLNLDSTELLQNSLFDDNLTNIDLDKELNSVDINDVRPSSGMSGPKLPDFGSSNTSFPTNNSIPTSNFGSNNSAFGSINTGGVSTNAGLSYEDVQKAKFDLLCKFERLRDKGVKIPKIFSMSSDYDEMKYEYDRLIHQRKMSNSVKMQRQMLVTFCSGLCFLNGKFDPLGVHLDGFDEHVNDNINDYDDIFEELYEKYKESAEMAPELKLMMTLGGSAFMYHLSNSVFKSAMPNPSDILKQNPELMKQFQTAAMNSMGQQNSGFANFMGNVMGNNQESVPRYNPMNSPPFANPRDAPPRGTTNVNDTDDIDNLLNSIQ
jgi:hypothetical protein